MPLTTYPVTPWSGPQPAQAGRTASAKCWVMGVVQFFIGLVLLGLGGTLFFASSNYNLCIAYWYPLWGAALYVISGYYNSSIATDSSRCLVSCSAVSSCLSFFASLIGTVLLARDLVKVSFLYPLPGSSTVFLYCERSHLPAEHCRRFLTYELGLLLLMIIFTVFEMTISSIMFSYSLTIQIMTGFMHIGFGIVLTTLTNVYTSVFVIGEIPFLGGVSFIISGCLSIGAEKSPTECAVKGSQTMNVISAIFALLGIVAFIIDLNLNGLYRSGFDYYSYLIMLAGNGISIVLLIFTILEFCIAVATANFWCRATRLSSNEAMLIVPSTTRADLAVPPTDLPQPPSYTELVAPDV
ncbi:uncharacterized protein [Struthio camelus]|uniref:uncharacterized protein isoform X1 n=1 Tax=Struthio camelus TaxID=8801 RepID=UPI0036041000